MSEPTPEVCQKCGLPIRHGLPRSSDECFSSGNFQSDHCRILELEKEVRTAEQRGRRDGWEEARKACRNKLAEQGRMLDALLETCTDHEDSRYAALFRDLDACIAALTPPVVERAASETKGDQQ